MRHIIRKLGIDVIKYPSRRIDSLSIENEQQRIVLEQLRSDNEQIRRDNERLSGELTSLIEDSELARNLNSQLALEKNLLAAKIAELETIADTRKYDYDSDCLRVYNKTVGFMNDERFLAAYKKGMDSGHHIGRPKNSRHDIGIHWRCHVTSWAAKQCLRLEGDFVECGVNTGIFSLTVCDYLAFENEKRKFFLFDTFAGIPLEQAAPEEKEKVKTWNDNLFSECYELAKSNFSAYPNVRLVRGVIPDSLNSVEIDKVAFLHIDLNIAYPELKSLEHFWNKLVPGAFVVLDDYGWRQHEKQKKDIDDFLEQFGVEALELPTGQGMFLRP